MTYIAVPVPVWEPVGESPLRATGITKPPAPEGAGVGGGASLGSWSIKDPSTIKRKPSEIANDSFKRASVKTKSKYGNLILNFCEYMEMCDKSGFRADGIAPGTNDSGLRSVSGPLCNRWHPDRRINWLAKMHRVSDWYEANRITGCTMITFTGYQENSGLSWYDTFDNITEARRKALKILRKALGKIDYFWVVEPHTENDTGYPHIHLAVFTVVDNYIRDTSCHVGWVKCEGRKDEAIWELMYGEGMEDKLRRLYSEEWGVGSHTYGLDFNVMKGEDDIKDLKNYLMKYIAKGYISDEGWSDGELIFNAHLYGATHGNRPPKEGEQLNSVGEFAKKYRLIGMSRQLSSILKPFHEEKEVVVWLDVDEIEPEGVRDDDGEIRLEDRIKSLFHRQFIPDWLDSPLWLDKEGRLRRTDPAELFIYQWGRQWTYAVKEKVTQYDEAAARRARKIQEDGYL